MDISIFPVSSRSFGNIRHIEVISNNEITKHNCIRNCKKMNTIDTLLINFHQNVYRSIAPCILSTTCCCAPLLLFNSNEACSNADSNSSVKHLHRGGCVLMSAANTLQYKGHNRLQMHYHTNCSTPSHLWSILCTWYQTVTTPICFS